MEVAIPVVLIRARMENKFISEAQKFIFICAFQIHFIKGYCISGKKKSE